ncbi:hypothetical protein [Wolbachia endosymbiont of Pentidionis agamae]|uniref:hypothetical protein n=1 Tax=Wolbachia endosymbiont of Pentidionis agamae TaxID=3110435 RepID=UPI002FD4EB2F
MVGSILGVGIFAFMGIALYKFIQHHKRNNTAPELELGSLFDSSLSSSSVSEIVTVESGRSSPGNPRQ